MASTHRQRRKLVRRLEKEAPSMFSPALRHRQKVLARQSGQPIDGKAKQAPAAPKADTDAGREYAALRVALHEDLLKLHDIASVEARNPKKVEMAKTYTDWVEGVLKAGEEGQAAQDEIVSTMMVWAIDTREFDYALRIAAHVLKFGLALPERYKREPACFLAEVVAETSLKMADSASHEVLLRVLALVDGFDMPDPAKAKLHKALGRSFARKAEAFDPAAESAPAGGKAAYTQQALEHFLRAFELDATCGVKTDIKTLERQLKALSDQASCNEPDGSQ